MMTDVELCEFADISELALIPLPVDLSVVELDRKIAGLKSLGEQAQGRELKAALLRECVEYRRDTDDRATRIKRLRVRELLQKYAAKARAYEGIQSAGDKLALEKLVAKEPIAQDLRLMAAQIGEYERQLRALDDA